MARLVDRFTNGERQGLLAILIILCLVLLILLLLSRRQNYPTVQIAQPQTEGLTDTIPSISVPTHHHTERKQHKANNRKKHSLPTKERSPLDEPVPSSITPQQ